MMGETAPVNLGSQKPVVACLRHEDPDHLGVGLDALEEEGLEVLYVDLWRGQRPPPVGGLAGVIVLGGEMNADEFSVYPFLTYERNLFRDCSILGVPALGICLGAQILARAYGAAVTPETCRELGFLPVRPTAELAADPLLSVYGEGDLVFRWHRDGFNVPDAGVLLLSGADPAPNQAFRVGSCWGVQFHPELTLDLLMLWCDMVAESLEKDYGSSKREVEEMAKRLLPSQQRQSAELFRRFAQLALRSPLRSNRDARESGIPPPAARGEDTTLAGAIPGGPVGSPGGPPPASR
jgi:GMP synthase (glutamine-hydrolysing)